MKNIELLEAARNNDFEKVKELVENDFKHEIDINYYDEKNGDTALMLAAGLHKNHDMTAFLVKNGAGYLFSIKIKDEKTRTYTVRLDKKIKDKKNESKQNNKNY